MGHGTYSSAILHSSDLVSLTQFLAFLRTIDANFETYDIYGTFPYSARTAARSTV